MSLRLLSGLERLAAVSVLLQRARVMAPRGGIWEAADLQWWWRRPRASDGLPAPVWFDEARQPAAAAVLTAWSHAWWLDVLRLPGWPGSLDELTAPARAQLEQLPPTTTLESMVPAGDAELVAWFERHGFVRAETSWSGWLPAAGRPAVVPLPAGFQLVDRVARGAAAAPEHPLVARNGPEVEARLRRTTLYDPRLDLAVLASDGSVAGYALFWNDGVTGVGLVEPVRVEEAYAGRGIATAMISAGLDRLARAGATRLKIGWESERAQEVYLRLGFTEVETFHTYRRAPPAR